MSVAEQLVDFLILANLDWFGHAAFRAHLHPHPCFDLVYSDGFDTNGRIGDLEHRRVGYLYNGLPFAPVDGPNDASTSAITKLLDELNRITRGSAPGFSR